MATADRRDLAGHIALAVSQYVPWARANGLRPPADELLKVANRLARWARKAKSNQDESGFDRWLGGLDDQGGMRPLLVDSRSAAGLLGVSPSSLQRLVRAGELHPVKVGGATRFRVTDLEAYAAQLAPRSWRATIQTKKGSADAENRPLRRRTIVRRAG